MPTHAAFLAVPGGPESLVIDTRAKVGYANLWKTSTVVIHLAGRKIVRTWPNGCQGSRGLALDAQHQRLFVGCAEGGADSLHTGYNGTILDRFRFGAGTDIVAYNPILAHLYVPASRRADGDRERREGRPDEPTRHRSTPPSAPIAPWQTIRSRCGCAIRRRDGCWW